MPPTAFRIWHAGANATDHGVHFFTPESAKALMRQQAIRGNLFSIDVDHMSLNEKSPPEARKAVGFHRLAVRDSETGPELWAVDVQWTAAVAEGLAQEVPEWRYFSPAYDVDEKTGEIIRYLNTALTNNPATWSVTALASAGVQEKKKMKSYEKLLSDLMGADEDKKNAAIAALAAAFPDDNGNGNAGGSDEKTGEDKKAKKASEGGDDDEAKKAKKAAEDAEEAKKAKKAAEDAEEAKKAAVARANADDKTGMEDKATLSNIHATLLSLGREITSIRSEREAEKTAAAKEKESTVRANLLAKRPDFPESVRSILAQVPISEVEKAVKDWPRTYAIPGSSVEAMFPQGEGPPARSEYIPRLDADEQRILANLNKPKDTSPVRATLRGNTFSMPTRQVTQEEAAKRVAEIDKELGN